MTDNMSKIGQSLLDDVTAIKRGTPAKIWTPEQLEDFLEYIPGYLRQSTAPGEGRYLDQVLAIINASS